MKELILESEIADILLKVADGRRLDFEDGVRLFRSFDIPALGWGGDLVRRRLNGDRTYFIVNRHINYTNVCNNRCRFCAFSKTEGEAGGYTLTVDDVVRKAEDASRDVDFTELHIVGGLHPTLSFEYYLNMLSALRERFPLVHVQAFTAVEIHHLASMAGLSVKEALERLKEVGLGSLPGGGAEVFSPRIRNELCAAKLSAEGWLEVMRTAHDIGMRSNATMLYGHIETPEEKVEHLLRLRDLQDETGGFLSFIPLAYHPTGTDLGVTRGRGGPSGVEDLRTISVSRMMLDNFPHVKAFWIMLGLKLAQVSLSFGADDFDGTVVEEKITHSAGAETPEGLSAAEIRRLIRETGTIPVERDTLYNEVRW